MPALAVLDLLPIVRMREQPARQIARRKTGPASSPSGSIARAVVGGSFVVARPMDAQPDAPFDIVLAGGRVIDPASGLDAIRHLGIRNGTIASLSAAPLRGATVVDVSGLVVVLTFIDPAFARADARGQPVPGARRRHDGARARERRHADRRLVRDARGPRAAQLRRHGRTHLLTHFGDARKRIGVAGDYVRPASPPPIPRYPYMIGRFVRRPTKTEDRRDDRASRTRPCRRVRWASGWVPPTRPALEPRRAAAGVRTGRAAEGFGLHPHAIGRRGRARRQPRRVAGSAGQRCRHRCGSAHRAHRQYGTSADAAFARR